MSIELVELTLNHPSFSFIKAIGKPDGVLDQQRIVKYQQFNTVSGDADTVSQMN